MKRFPFANVLALIGCFLSLQAAAEDWSQFRGPAGDGISGETIGSVSTGDLNIQWKVPAPLGFSSLSIADGRAVTWIARPDSSGQPKETVLALDAQTGQELWAVPFGSSDYPQGGGGAGAPGNRGGDGPRSTPLIDGDRVYVYDSYMKLACLDVATGKPIWQQDIIADFAGRNIKWLNASSPLVVGDRVIVGGGGKGESFLAFDKTSGDLVWKSGDETITHATPCVWSDGGQTKVVFFTQSGLVAVNSENGNEVWRAKFPFSVSTAASPVVDGPLVYCSAGYGVGAGLFQVGSSDEAKEVWYKSNELMNHWSTPVVHDGHLYGLFEFKKYGRAPLQCVELATGKIKWAERGFGPGNCILVGDKLVVLSDAGELVIATARADRYEELARMDAVSGKCWSTPAFSNGAIYLRSTEEAAKVSIGNSL